MLFCAFAAALLPLFAAATIVLGGNTSPGTLLTLGVVSTLLCVATLLMGRVTLSDLYHTEEDLEEGETYEVIRINGYSKVVTLSLIGGRRMQFIFPSSDLHTKFKPGEMFRVNESDAYDEESPLSLRMVKVHAL